MKQNLFENSRSQKAYGAKATSRWSQRGSCSKVAVVVASVI